MKRMLVLAAVCFSVIHVTVLAEGQARNRLVFDRAHGELPPPEPLSPLAQKLGLDMQISTAPLTSSALEGARIVYLRAPSGEFTDAEAAAVIAFVKGGGSLLLVLDQEQRQSLAKTRVNTIISPFGLRLTPDTEYLRNTGAVAKAGEINKADRNVPYDGGRAVEGGTPFAYQLDKEGKPAQPYGAYTQVEGGGRIIVLSEGMASLFLGDPKAVRLAGDDNGTMSWWGPDSAIFMEEVLTWLAAASPK